jgi:uncharacterized repeat protein (TIGR03803 family)
VGVAADLALPRALAAGAPPPGPGWNVHYKTLHHFSGRDGALPLAGLILHSDGSAYGTTANGGRFDRGTVYRLTDDQRVKVLHSFADRPRDGAAPLSSVAEGDDGALYGVTPFGGQAVGRDGGVAYRLARGSGYDVLHDFGRTATDGDSSVAGLTLASDRCFYGATRYGGDHGFGVVYRMDTAGVVTPIWSLPANPDPANPYAAPIEGMDGTLYGTSMNGGSEGWGTIYALSRSGRNARVLHSFAFDDGGRPQVGVIQAGDRALYGTTPTNGPDSGGTVYRLGLDGAFDVLHAFALDAQGYYPSSPLLELESGIFVGTTTGGGEHGEGVVFMVGTDGSYRRLHSFGGRADGAPDGFGAAGSLLLIALPGHIVGVCASGGAYGLGTIWSIELTRDGGAPAT